MDIRTDFLRLPSKHTYPSPIGTSFHVWYGDRFKYGDEQERGEELVTVTVTEYYDDLRYGNFYMRLADEEGNAQNIDRDDEEEIVKALLEQGWEMGFKIDY